jgi:hypothetical protein
MNAVAVLPKSRGEKGGYYYHGYSRGLDVCIPEPLFRDDIYTTYKRVCETCTGLVRLGSLHSVYQQLLLCLLEITKRRSTLHQPISFFAHCAVEYDS